MYELLISASLCSFIASGLWHPVLDGLGDDLVSLERLVQAWSEAITPECRYVVCRNSAARLTSLLWEFQALMLRKRAVPRNACHMHHSSTITDLTQQVSNAFLDD